MKVDVRGVVEEITSYQFADDGEVVKSEEGDSVLIVSGEDQDSVEIYHADIPHLIEALLRWKEDFNEQS